MNDIVSQASFAIGQIVHHKLFNYRGVIFEIDSRMMLGDDWYNQVAKSRPPKEEPWYHVMVDNAVHTTYVAQQNLQVSHDLSPVTHPDISLIFSDFYEGRYHLHASQMQ